MAGLSDMYGGVLMSGGDIQRQIERHYQEMMLDHKYFAYLGVEQPQQQKQSEPDPLLLLCD